MTKKQKRQVSRSEVETTPAVNTKSVTPRASTRAAATSAEFNPDYSYVTRDLKRIGILAGSFVVILVVLSFFLS